MSEPEIPKLTDLEEDIEEFVQYQADKSHEALNGIQGHLETLERGEKITFCMWCILNHFSDLSGLGTECITAACPAQPIWREMQSWAMRNKKEYLEMLRGKKLPTKKEALKLAQETRNFRKEMEKLMIGEKESSGKHLQ